MNKGFIKEKFEQSLDCNSIDNSLYEINNVKKGLRNANGTGVLVGLTKICDVYGYKMEGKKKIDDEGHLYYRGIDLYELAKSDNDAFGFEKTCFLILFGYYPSKEEAKEFIKIISSNYSLPSEFLENSIMKNVSSNLMNHIQRAILSLYTYDKTADSVDPLETLIKGINIMSKMPAIISYSLQAKSHYIDNDSLSIHHPKKNYSIAENILYMSRNNGKFTKKEAETLDLALIIHADHGGGNNSTFANIVISSSGTDIYSAISGGLGSLKGPRHGGASRAVHDMMEEVIKYIGLEPTDNQIVETVNKILDKDFYDQTGLVYGIGHAIYTLSDPRAQLLKAKSKELVLSEDENAQKLFSVYERFERISISQLKIRKGNCYNCCANLDYYSGLMYKLLDIPMDLFTPIFATARTVGWIAHNIENKMYCNRIIRPAAKYVGEIVCKGGKKNV